MTNLVPPPPAPPVRRRASLKLILFFAILGAFIGGFALATVAGGEAEASDEFVFLEETLAQEKQRADGEAERADAAEKELRAAEKELLETRATMTVHKEAVEAREAELVVKETELAEREGQLNSAEKRVEETRISEGTWTVGEDVKAGTYKTIDEVSNCYWAITRSGSNGDDIISNDIVTGGRPTVTLQKGQDFTTNRCGSWDRK